MRLFNRVDKVFMKSNNSTSKIFRRYLTCLIPFIFLILIYNFIWGDKAIVIDLFKSIGVAMISGILTGYICNLVKKEKSLKKIFVNNYIFIITIIVGLCSINASIIVTMVASSVSVIAKSFCKNMTTSASLYGILLVLLFVSNGSNPLDNLKVLDYVSSYDQVMESYGNIVSYLLGVNYYLSPLLAIISFLYLFFKKSIKYNIVLVYLLTFSFVIGIYGLFNGMNLWYLLFHLCTGNILFLSVFCLPDYPNTPIIYEGQMIYGIILGLISAILRFIIPVYSIVVTFIFGSLFFSSWIDKISIKLKYNKKSYYMSLMGCILAVICVTIGLNIIY